MKKARGRVSQEKGVQDFLLGDGSDVISLCLRLVSFAVSLLF